MPHVTCIFLFIFYLQNILQNGGASRWRVCYQWGLPRLVIIQFALVHGFMNLNAAQRSALDCTALHCNMLLYLLKIKLLKEGFEEP